MKNRLPVLAILVVGITFASCIKETVPKPPPGGGSSTSTSKKTTSDTTTSQPIVPIDPNMLDGIWRVVNDTSTTVPWGLWQGHPTTGSNYMGVPTDYYKLTATGNCYTRIQNVVDTANYTVNQNQVHVIFTYFNGQETTSGIYNSTWTVSNLTNHTCTLTVTYVSPETATTSVTNLAKN
jgi:hypothetical protein